jgi:hypothetical protein
LQRAAYFSEGTSNGPNHMNFILPKDRILSLPSWCRRLIPGVFLLPALCLLPLPAQGASYGVNLIVNGNAEQGSFSPTGDPLSGSNPVPGWVVSSAFTVVNYKTSGDGSGFPKVTDSGPPDRQNQFFAGGQNAAISTATQEIDLTANAADINAGLVTFDLTGWFGGYLTDDDNAALGIDFYNGTTKLTSGSIGGVTAADRNNQTGLLFRGATGVPMPVNTTRLVLTLTMTRLNGTFNDGYADSLSLVLRRPVVVTSTFDSGPGSLRQALAAGNAITFDPTVFSSANGPHVITLLSALPDINSSMTITGPGANVLTVQRSTASGTPNFRIFNVTNVPPIPPTITISGLTISNGTGSGLGNTHGAGIQNSGYLTLNNSVVTGCQTNGVGGGIVNFGRLTLNSSIVTGNKALSSGGGIYNGGTVTIDKCTISSNTDRSVGGGIFNSGIAQIDKCTISGNATINSNGGIGGGGIANENNGSNSASLALSNCTISGNSAAMGGGSVENSLDDVNASSNLIISNCTFSGSFNVLNDGGSVFVDNTIFFETGAGGLNLRSNGGIITSRGYNMANDGGGGFLNQTGDRLNTDPMLGPLQDNGGPTFTHALLPGSLAIDKGNSSLTTDQRGFTRPVDFPDIPNAQGGNGSDIGAFEVQMAAPTPTPTPTATPGLVANVSTRLPVGTGDNVLIEGFIVQGPAGSTKKIIVRAIGPSLVPFGVTDALGNPTLEIHDANKVMIATNNDWRTTQVGGIVTGDQSAEISASGLAPSNDLESAIIANLAPGSYTAVVQGFGNTVGTGVVDAFDVSAASLARVANFATRGLIQPGDKLMIAGFIVQNGPVRAVVCAIGPSLTAFGVPNALADTTLQITNQNGAVIAENDNWKTRPDGSSQQAELESTGLQPTDDLEAAVLINLQPGQYSALVRGKPEGTGIGVVQVYFLQ